MAYITAELEDKAVEAITKFNLMFIEDILAHIGIAKQTFYDHKLDESDRIKAGLENNRIKTKLAMRKKWFESENPTLQIGLMKLIGDSDERKKLSQGFIDITTKDDKITHNPFTTMSDAELAKLAVEYIAASPPEETEDDTTETPQS